MAIPTRANLRGTVFQISLTALVLWLSGCGGMVEMVQLPHQNADQWRTFDPNDYGIEMIRKEDGSISYTWQRDAYLQQPDIVLPYWKKWGNMIDLNSTVRGQLNGRSYPVVFDTGCDPMILLGEKIIRDNDLAVFFFNPEDKSTSRGLVIVDSLQIGDFRMTDYPCGLWKHRAELQVLGIPLARAEMIIMPLNMMRRFTYFKYDNINSMLSFSSASSFQPFPQLAWMPVPFRIEGPYLLVDVPIEGIPVTLRVDTGAGYQLKLDESIVRQMLKTRPDYEEARKSTRYLYGPYEGGKTAETRFTAKNLHFAEKTLDRVELYYSKIADDAYQGVIGAELFTDTVMVLDFENGIMWIKKAKHSRFEEAA